jgi:hypothetical protein
MEKPTQKPLLPWLAILLCLIASEAGLSAETNLGGTVPVPPGSRVEMPGDGKFTIHGDGGSEAFICTCIASEGKEFEKLTGKCNLTISEAGINCTNGAQDKCSGACSIFTATGAHP